MFNPRLFRTTPQTLQGKSPFSSVSFITWVLSVLELRQSWLGKLRGGGEKRAVVIEIWQFPIIFYYSLLRAASSFPCDFRNREVIVMLVCLCISRINPSNYFVQIKGFLLVMHWVGFFSLSRNRKIFFIHVGIQLLAIMFANHLKKVYIP